jgi:hypothetical protein
VVAKLTNAAPNGNGAKIPKVKTPVAMSSEERLNAKRSKRRRKNANAIVVVVD